MTAANVLDGISRLPGCSGQASDVVSAYTQVKMKDARDRLHFSEEDCFGSDYRKQENNKNGTLLTIQLYHWSGIFTVTHWLDTHGRNNSRKFCLQKNGKGPRMGVPKVSSQIAIVVLVSVCGRQIDSRDKSEHAKDVG